MSYRDVRNFSEMLRALGYPSPISMEAFRTANFPLVAHILVWLTKRFDPDIEIANQTSTESDRIKLIRNSAEFMALKANIKLNTKRLYQADGYAVKELVKITALLYEALNSNSSERDDEDGGYDDDSYASNSFDIGDKINELKLSRQLASEITATGAALFDLLGKEAELRPARYKSVGRQYELGDIETGIKQTTESLKSQINEAKAEITSIATTEANLDAKIERRKIEIERYDKRLQTLKKVRPAFLEEFTQLEKELEQLFVQYSLKTRVLTHLERLVAEAERNQYEKQLLIASPRVETIPLETLEQEEKEERAERPRASTGGRVRTAKVPKVFGGMQPPVSGTPELDSDTDSDELFIDKDESELLHSEEEDDESLGLESEGVGKMRAQSNNASRPVDNSDDDF